MTGYGKTPRREHSEFREVPSPQKFYAADRWFESIHCSIFIALALLAAGCKRSVIVDAVAAKQPNHHISAQSFSTGFRPDMIVITFDGHEYLGLYYNETGGLIHSESCPCKLR